MYWLDPQIGRRRRAMFGEMFRSRAKRTRHAIDVAGRDLANRVRGTTARARSRFQHRDASDELIEERVRAALGRAVSHPGAISVCARQGRVTLEGDVLKHEHDELVRAVSAVQGVEDIEGRLRVHKTPERISSLQGGGRRLARGVGSPRGNWSPALRLLASASGIALLTMQTRQRNTFGAVCGAAGGILLLRSATNMPFERLFGASGRRAIDIRKTLHINAPIEHVFETMSRFENFPSFMRNVRRVSLHDQRRSHWVVAGPAGTSVEWDAETSAFVPNEVLAWRTVRNSTVEHAGIIRFEREGEGTRIDIQMTYNPPAGAFGHAFAKLFGADAKTELDEGLLRSKTLLETGVPARDAAVREDASATSTSFEPRPQQDGDASSAQPGL